MKLLCPNPKCHMMHDYEPHMNFCPGCGTAVTPTENLAHVETTRAESERRRNAKELAHHMAWLIEKGLIR